MEKLHFAALLVIFQILSVSTTCFADSNSNLGSQCDESSTLDNEFQIILRNLLDSLASNGPLQNGFYKTESGKKSEKVYGLVQCRGDISTTNCGNCIDNATKALHWCPKSRTVWIWLKWCFLRYSNVSFFGTVDQSSGAWSNGTDFDVPLMGTKGLDFMGSLAYNASKQPLKFQTSVLDVGESGKRYGMAQCTRDISQAECHKCLNNQLETFREVIGNKRGWEIHGSNCFMWYYDYQFYFNISTPASQGGRPASHKAAALVLVSVILSLQTVL